MPISPISVTPNSFEGQVAQLLSDLGRRVTSLESVQTSIAAGAIKKGMIGGGAVVAGTIDALAISAGTIQTGQINAGHMTANSIETASIVAEAVTAEKIKAHTITAALIEAGTITANEIKTGTITATQVYAGSIDAQKIQASQVFASTLSAITSNMGAITAGTITGATLQTGTGGARVVINSAGLVGYALNGVTKVFEINAGTGVASFTGIANVDPSSVIPGGTISGNGTVPGSRIVDNSIDTLQLRAGSVDANVIKAGSILASNLTVDLFDSRNMLNNASFEDSTSMLGWTSHGPGVATALAASAPHGAKVAQITGNGTGNAGVKQTVQGLTAGKKYVLSFYNRRGSAGATMNAIASINWLDAGGNILLSSDGTPIATSTTDWTRAQVVAQAPTNATQAIVFALMTNITNGTTAFIDAVQFEEQGVVAGVPTVFQPRYGEILTGSVGPTQITPNSITSAQITTSSLASDRIQANQVSVTSLSALTANMGTLTAGTITGALIQTSATGGRVLLNSAMLQAYTSDPLGERVEITSMGIRGYNALNAQTMNMTPRGKFTMYADGSGQYNGLDWYNGPNFVGAVKVADAETSGIGYNIITLQSTMTGANGPARSELVAGSVDSGTTNARLAAFKDSTTRSIYASMDSNAVSTTLLNHADKSSYIRGNRSVNTLNYEIHRMRMLTGAINFGSGVGGGASTTAWVTFPNTNFGTDPNLFYVSGSVSNLSNAHVVTWWLFASSGSMLQIGITNNLVGQTAYGVLSLTVLCDTT